MQTLKLMKVTMESRAQDAADDVGNFLQGDGTSFGGKAPNGLLNTVDNKLKSVVSKLGYMLETLVRSFVLMPVMA